MTSSSSHGALSSSLKGNQSLFGSVRRKKKSWKTITWKPRGSWCIDETLTEGWSVTPRTLEIFAIFFGMNEGFCVKASKYRSVKPKLYFIDHHRVYRYNIASHRSAQEIYSSCLMALETLIYPTKLGPVQWVRLCNCVCDYAWVALFSLIPQSQDFSLRLKNSTLYTSGRFSPIFNVDQNYFC